MRILVFLRNEGLLQFPEPQLEQGGGDVGIPDGRQRQLSLLYHQLEGVDFINVTRDPGVG